MDHCRIGSLETLADMYRERVRDHCRIGSLETWKTDIPFTPVRSLPHRQLRNVTADTVGCPLGSLPHRQLRNYDYMIAQCAMGSLPHRQLRNKIDHFPMQTTVITAA